MSNPGTRVIRVTEPLNFFKHPKIVDWMVKEGKKESGRISRAAMKVGSRVDELVKTNTQPIKKDKLEVVSAYNAYYKWARNYTPITVTPLKRVEKVIYGVILSGEPDFEALDVLTDLKCSARISKSYWLQLAAYAWLIDWLGKIAILRCDKATEAYQYEVRENLARYWEVYKGMLLSYIYFTEEEDDGGNDIV